MGEPGRDGSQGLKGDKGDRGAPGPKGPKGDRGDKGDSVDAAPFIEKIENKFNSLSEVVDKRISRIAFSAVTGHSAGSGEVNLHKLDDVDYNSVKNPTNGQSLVYSSSLGKWQANTAGGSTSQYLQVANASALYLTKTATANTYLNAKTITAQSVNSAITFNKSATVTKNLTVSGNTTISGLIANGSLGVSGYALKTNGTSVYWGGIVGATAFSGNTSSVATSVSSVTLNSAIVANPVGHLLISVSGVNYKVPYF